MKYIYDKLGKIDLEKIFTYLDAWDKLDKAKELNALNYVRKDIEETKFGAVFYSGLVNDKGEPDGFGRFIRKDGT